MVDGLVSYCKLELEQSMGGHENPLESQGGFQFYLVSRFKLCRNGISTDLWVHARPQDSPYLGWSGVWTESLGIAG